MREGVRRAALFALAAGAAVLLLATAGPAQAQEDPYGSTTTTTVDRGPQPSCRLREDVVAAGETATARLKAVPRGSRVEIRFDGRVVAEAVATGPGQSPRVNMDVDFVVPADAEPGDHEVSAVGANFTTSCGTLDTRTTEVLAAEATNDANGTGSGSRSGSLPRTGTYVALLLVIGVALVIVGRAVRDVARQRARAARAHPHRRDPTRR